ncbi:MAG: hypothetical protein UT63_C0009G0008 [Candidatus Gottesmanbacteria bacterium GW2011_GWC2_39_8]|uniref:Uncharacterized protein n=1 Tax=Candidatus Gottesmanbacteria bacterium GW2011_GWC2_39_8 TaxID=1618450 RepID=A0A0G0Q1D7_9BACT|nr:MAG: hypothetical protein UT63_C0009G0008 [Candidatus Gottesmanbacteria bacterium GW2011_GWC2_39_8]
MKGLPAGRQGLLRYARNDSIKMTSSLVMVTEMRSSEGLVWVIWCPE